MSCGRSFSHTSLYHVLKEKVMWDPEHVMCPLSLISHLDTPTLLGGCECQESVLRDGDLVALRLPHKHKVLSTKKEKERKKVVYLKHIA